MPWEIATYLLGAQGGVQDDFARLYDATNPVLVRYLRVITDAGPDELAELAISAWSAALPQLTACPPDQDAWLELVIGSARVAASGNLRGAGASSATADPAPNGLDRAIEALRACPPDEADVLAMGLVANLGRDATARLTGHEPSAVLALVQRGQEHLTMSLESLTAALRGPATPSEVADLQRVTPLIATAVAGPVPIAGGDTEAVQATSVAVALSASHARPGRPVDALAEPSLAELLSMESAAAASSGVVSLSAFRSAAGTPSRSARFGVGAGVWLLAVGGVGTAAAMTGFITAAIDGIFGNHNAAPLVTAEGPATPGTPFPRGNTGGGTGGNTGGGTGGNVPTGPATGPGRTGHTSTPTARQPATGGGSAQAVSLPGRSGTTQIVLASFAIPTDSIPATPSVPATTPTTPTVVLPGPVALPPVSGPAPLQGNGNGKSNGNGNVNVNVKTVAQPTRQAARAASSAAKASAKAQGKARASAAKATKVTATKVKATKVKATKVKATSQGQALGHAKLTARGKALGHAKS